MVAPHTGTVNRVGASLENLFRKRSIGDRTNAHTPHQREYTFYGNNKAFYDDWFDNKSHAMLLVGPAETGKTICCLSILHRECLENPGLECLMVRKVRKHVYNTVARSLISDILPDNHEALGYTIYGGENQPEIIIYPPDENGKRSRIYIGGMDGVGTDEQSDELSNILGGQFDIIYFNQVEQSSRRDLDILRSRCTGRKKGFVRGPRLGGLLLDANPAHPGHYLLSLERDGHLAIYNSRHKDNPDLYDQETGELTERGELALGELSALSGVQRERLLLGRWAGAGGQYFATFNPLVHGIKREDFIFDPRWPVWAAMDYGYAHPNITQLCTESPEYGMVTLHEIVSIQMRPYEIAPIIHEVLDEWGLVVDDLEVFYVGTDAFKKTGQADLTVSEQYAEYDIILTGADMTPGSRVRRAHTMGRMLGRDDGTVDPTWHYIRETCSSLENQIPAMVSDPKNSEDFKKVNANSEGEGGDDSVDCWGYSIRDINQNSHMNDLKKKLEKLRAQRRR